MEFDLCTHPKHLEAVGCCEAPGENVHLNDICLITLLPNGGMKENV